MVFLQFRHLQYLQSCLYINMKKLSIFLLWAIFNTCRISTLSYFGEDCFYSYGHYGLISLEDMCRLFMQNFLAKLSTWNRIILKAHMVLFCFCSDCRLYHRSMCSKLSVPRSGFLMSMKSMPPVLSSYQVSRSLSPFTKPEK